MLDNKHQKYKSVHVKETCKVAEISDAFNNLRYKVIMTSYDIINDNVQKLAYQIQVVNYFLGPEPLIILERPEEGEPWIVCYQTAIKIYEECVKNYTRLVKAETRDYQDIDVFKEKIGYKETCPECCMTCKWSRFNSPVHDYIHKISAKCHCHNPKNCSEYNFDIDKTTIENSNRYRFEEFHGHHCLPQDDSHISIYPKVNIFGICNNYENKKETIR